MTTPTNQPGDENLLDRFATIRIFRRGEERAPHKVFDRGALSLDNGHRFLISQHLRDTQGAREWLFRFAGQPLRGPQPGCTSPAAKYLGWHRKEVFRSPPALSGAREDRQNVV